MKTFFLAMYEAICAIKKHKSERKNYHTGS
jgi:hypothetical protein